MVDIVTALATAAKSIEIVKALKDIERDLDSSAYKIQISELYSNLADVKMALSDAKQKIHDLESELEASKIGDMCPVCSEGRLKVLQITPHPDFNTQGIKEKHVQCKSCHYKDKLLYDPNNIITRK